MDFSYRAGAPKATPGNQGLASPTVHRQMHGIKHVGNVDSPVAAMGPAPTMANIAVSARTDIKNSGQVFVSGFARAGKAGARWARGLEECDWLSASHRARAQKGVWSRECQEWRSVFAPAAPRAHEFLGVVARLRSQAKAVAAQKQRQRLSMAEAHSAGRKAVAEELARREDFRAYLAPKGQVVKMTGAGPVVQIDNRRRGIALEEADLLKKIGQRVARQKPKAARPPVSDEAGRAGGAHRRRKVRWGTRRPRGHRPTKLPFPRRPKKAAGEAKIMAPSPRATDAGERAAARARFAFLLRALLRPDSLGLAPSAYPSVEGGEGAAAAAALFWALASMLIVAGPAVAICWLVCLGVAFGRARPSRWCWPASVRPDADVISRAKVLASEADAHNRAMHSANGNIGPQVEDRTKDFSTRLYAAGEYATARLPALGNAMVVITEYLYGGRPERGGRAGVRSFDATMLRETFSLDIGVERGNHRATNARGTVVHENAYQLSYPQGSGRVPLERRDVTSVEMLVPENELEVSQVASMPDRPWPELCGPNRLKRADASAFWNPGASPTEFARAESDIYASRFAGPRGNRQVLGWEAQAPNRGMALGHIAQAEAHGSSYYRFFFHLWHEFILCCMVEGTVTSWGPRAQDNQLVPRNISGPRDLDYDVAGGDIRKTIRLIPMSARAAPTAAGLMVNPEAAFQTDANAASNIAAVADGEEAFLDIEGLSDDQVRAAIRLLASRDWELAWGFDTHERAVGGGPEPGTFFTTWLNRSNEFHDGAPGVNKIYVHYGARIGESQRDCEYRFLGRGAPADPERGLDPIEANPANSPWMQPPTRGLLTSVALRFISLHAASRDAWDAWDAVVYRIAAYNPERLPSTVRGAGNGRVYAFGDRDIALPRDLTLGGYFDRVRHQVSPALDAPDVMQILSAHSRAVLWSTFYAAHALAVSLNWSTYALSMRQEEWRVVNGTLVAASQYQAAHVNGLTRRYGETDLTAASVFHATACAMMYGLRPDNFTLLTSTQSVAPIYTPRQAPFLANAYHEMWMLDMLPHHMSLPLPDSVPSWPTTAPKPMASATDRIRPRVRLSRDLEPFIGRGYIQDGGMHANAQFYASVSAGRGTNGIWRFRSDLAAPITPDIGLASWNSPFQYEWPVAPGTFQPTWLGPQNSVMGAYLLPGSIQNWSAGPNRIQAIGVESTADNDFVRAAFARLTLEERPASVAIEYVLPSQFRVEEPGGSDFSILIWANEDGSYATQSLVPNTANVSADLQPPGSGSSAYRLPSHLANHNTVHHYGWGGAEQASSTRDAGSGTMAGKGVFNFGTRSSQGARDRSGSAMPESIGSGQGVTYSVGRGAYHQEPGRVIAKIAAARALAAEEQAQAAAAADEARAGALREQAEDSYRGRSFSPGPIVDRSHKATQPPPAAGGPSGRTPGPAYVPKNPVDQAGARDRVLGAGGGGRASSRVQPPSRLPGATRGGAEGKPPGTTGDRLPFPPTKTPSGGKPRGGQTKQVGSGSDPVDSQRAEVAPKLQAVADATASLYRARGGRDQRAAADKLDQAQAALAAWIVSNTGPGAKRSDGGGGAKPAPEEPPIGQVLNPGDNKEADLSPITDEANDAGAGQAQSRLQEVLGRPPVSGGDRDPDKLGDPALDRVIAEDAAADFLARTDPGPDIPSDDPEN